MHPMANLNKRKRVWVWLPQFSGRRGDLEGFRGIVAQRSSIGSGCPESLSFKGPRIHSWPCGGVSVIHAVIDAIVALAALVAILDYFGLKPKHPLWGLAMPLNRNWKLGIMLGLVAASLGLSGYGFYRSLRPRIVERIVEKPVDRVVERVVQAECPKSAVQSSVPPKSVHAAGVSTSGSSSPAVGGITQGAGSIAQVGGSHNQATIVSESPDLTMSETQEKQVAESLGQGTLAGIKISLTILQPSKSTQDFGVKFRRALESSGALVTTNEAGMLMPPVGTILHKGISVTSFPPEAIQSLRRIGRALMSAQIIKIPLHCDPLNSPSIEILINRGMDEEEQTKQP